MKLHALMAESNHIHFVLTDDTPAHEPSELPDFFGLLHSLIARALNARYGRGENLFKTGSYDNVEIHGDVSFERQLVYLWTNPVKDVEGRVVAAGTHGPSVSRSGTSA